MRGFSRILFDAHCRRKNKSVMCRCRYVDYVNSIACAWSASILCLSLSKYKTKTQSPHSSSPTRERTPKRKKFNAFLYGRTALKLYMARDRDYVCPVNLRDWVCMYVHDEYRLLLLPPLLLLVWDSRRHFFCT